jgi:peptidylprolyl isomerase
MRSRELIACGLAALSLGLAACGDDETEKAEDDSTEEVQPAKPAPPESAPADAPPETSGALKEKPKIAKPKGAPPKQLVVKDLVKGRGAVAKAGSQLSVNYVGVSHSSGKEFDSSFDSGQPFQFELGASMVIPGWDEGLEGMKVGGRRMLTIPPEKAYGPQGSPPAIGPNETLVFVIDLLGVQ